MEFLLMIAVVIAVIAMAIWLGKTLVSLMFTVIGWIFHAVLWLVTLPFKLLFNR